MFKMTYEKLISISLEKNTQPELKCIKNLNLQYGDNVMINFRDEIIQFIIRSETIERVKYIVETIKSNLLSTKEEIVSEIKGLNILNSDILNFVLSDYLTTIQIQSESNIYNIPRPHKDSDYWNIQKQLQTIENSYKFFY